ncbi:YhgN family NAAT transporter [Steroidobacter cummioxidans]|uniref:YhgN family NAAT transporter n=1 Tax=Steroidobacter cummioxidans TaxID=1803913 RepID=UPI000E318BF6|nr:YhgN family NAAT transporter [Steroidobacter cummioxidans]
MDILSAVITLWLIMDPLGNVPVFLAVLKRVPPERRRKVLVREVLIAYAVLIFFMLVGDRALTLLQIKQETISIAGGIVLFLIALRMIFPEPGGHEDSAHDEPLVVPLAIPLIAGPSTLAALLLLRATAESTFQLWLATTIAWSATAAILIAAPFFYRALGERGLVAMERLMGMVLVMISVQMFLNGVATFLHMA